MAELLHYFKWAIPLDDKNVQIKELDMTERFNGVISPKAQELWAIPTPRLECIAHLK